LIRERSQVILRAKKIVRPNQLEGGVPKGKKTVSRKKRVPSQPPKKVQKRRPKRGLVRASGKGNQSVGSGIFTAVHTGSERESDRIFRKRSVKRKRRQREKTWSCRRWGGYKSKNRS